MSDTAGTREAGAPIGPASASPSPPAGDGEPLTREQQAASLPADVKARLNKLTDREAEKLDVTSDEHQYVWGFRQNRPDEEHAERLADATAGKDDWHAKTTAAGHDMTWELEDRGVGYAATWYGSCRSCGAGMSVSYGCTSAGRRSFRCARDVPCRGPGTAWQDEMQYEVAVERLRDAVAQFGQDVKDQHDQAWLDGQGLGTEER